MKWKLRSIHDPLESAGPDARVLLISRHQIFHASLDRQLQPVLQSLVEKRLFQGQPGSTYILPVWKKDHFETYILTGRTEGPLTAGELRQAAAYAARAAIKLGARRLEMDIPSTMQEFMVEQDAEGCAQALCEGFILGSQRAKHYRREQPEQAQLEEITFQLDGPVEPGFQEAWEEGVRWGSSIGDGVVLARRLTNLPGNLLVPSDLAQAALELAERYGMEADIIDEERLAQLGMGALLAVGKGSAHPPQMIVIKYQGTDTWEHVTGLVGKGITFDTGGISLKRGSGMEEMIGDMGGAAAVLGVMEVLGQRRPKVNVVMVVPTAENMPDGNAVKPGDVITTLSGRTVEVLNTDAEGRMVLADGVTYAKALGAERIIDVATLTGAVEVALGQAATGAVTNDDVFMQELITASRRAGENVWPLPSYPEYWDMLKSDVADLRNSTGRMAGAITAGLFVGTFADGLPWIHLDIAGTSWSRKESGLEAKGGTGVMVRTLTEWVRSQEEISDIRP
ncbi:leucyl aminopeptidase [Paenibacillus sp. JSM ZJ436]|uniref:leucyl aminopeptidase n=1 Tax=Paenibacillus sp. JSM ZJ436 TaxID=3376190 RepID=UPI0037B735FD